MMSGDPNDYPLLESFSLAAFPRTTHNLAWSPDAELAIACDDCVFVFIPEFSSLPPASSRSPSPSPSSSPSSLAQQQRHQQQRRHDAPRQYDEAALRFPVNPIKGPALNQHLFSAAGRGETTPAAALALALALAAYEGAGSGTVTSQGSSLNHVVALGWSAGGLGPGRPALGALASSGILTVYCEGEGEGAAGAAKLGGRSSRALRPWAAAWSVGGGMLIPAAGAPGARQYLGCEYVTAFAWAGEVELGPGGRRAAAVLAYGNDDDEIVVVLVQRRRDYEEASSGGGAGWRVEEVSRFAAEGPHPVSDPTDPDYSPSGSSFSLGWSPWLDRGSSKSSMLSYTARGYVGFRQVTIEEPDDATSEPVVRVGDVDAGGVCLYLAPDAFVVWEDLIWTRSGSKVCRGIIATPARVQAFQLPFDATSANTTHAMDECGSAYPLAEDNMQAGNPITGLVIHPPRDSNMTSAPSYSLVRLSATSENKGWYQTNLPQSPDSADTKGGPRWVAEISQVIERQLPRALAYGRMNSPGGSSAASDMSSDEDYSDSDDFATGSKGGDDDDMGHLLGVSQLDTSDQVHTSRIRIWGMAASPGGGTTAVFVSEHSTIKPERDTYSGLNCRVLFGRAGHGGSGSNVGGDAATTRALSTEARMWEWIYGSGPPVPGISAPTAANRSGGDDDERVALRDHFALVSRQQVCAFCDTQLEPSSDGKSSRCGRGHVFENCVATQVPILAPGTSNACGVCGSKCLKPGQLVVIAPQLRRIVEDEISAELCGGCGGKFIN